jgi:hypothetical protein
VMSDSGSGSCNADETMVSALCSGPMAAIASDNGASCNADNAGQPKVRLVCAKK